MQAKVENGHALDNDPSGVGFSRHIPLPVLDTMTRHAWRTVAADLTTGLCTVAGVTALHVAQVWTVAGAPALFVAYGLFFAVLMFAYRSSANVFSAQTNWHKVPLLSAVAYALSLTLPLSAQESLASSWTAHLLLAGTAIAAPTIAFRLAGAFFSIGSIDERFRRRVAIFGANAESLALHEALEQSDKEYVFAGLFDDRRSTSRIENTVTPLSGTLAQLVRLVQGGNIDEVVICLPRQATRRVQEITEKLRGYSVNVHIAAHFIENEDLANSSHSMVRMIGNAGLVQVHAKPIRGWGLFWKEAMDRVGAAVLLAAVCPIFAVIAAAIKLDSKGPVFFRQRRHGLMGRTITVWKFRTMHCAEDGPVVQQAQKNDPRVTRVGAFLRKTSLDELPQLINVLLGEMSLVGPRPHAIAHNEHYGAIIERYDHRNQVKPGITGWAQINGLRGETSTPKQMEMRVAHDLAYIGNWSVWLDIKVLFLTPVYGFVSRNAY